MERLDETDAALRAGPDDALVERDHIEGIVDPHPRLLAWSARRRHGLLDADDVQTMIRDDAAMVRRRGIEFAIERPSVDLIEILEGVDVELAELAAFAIGERAHATEAEVEALVRTATGHEDALCRESSIAALGAVAADRDGAVGDDIREAILAGCRDKAAVRRRAVIALAAIDHESVDAALDRALQDRDAQVRRAARELTAEPDS